MSGFARANPFRIPQPDGPQSMRPRMVASGWRRVERGTLRGFRSLELASGLKINDCSLHEKDGRRWIGLPVKPKLDKDGKQLITPKTGKPAYSAILELASPAAHTRFQEQALRALAELLGEGRP